MQRLLASAVFAYAVLSAAQWRQATRWLFASPGVCWCGNVVSDPFGLLVNVAGPLAALCTAVLVCRGIKTRRGTSYAITALLTFSVTSACLCYEANVLGRYGLEIGRVWWLPWR